jgi:hypothetical protein
VTRDAPTSQDNVFAVLAGWAVGNMAGTTRITSVQSGQTLNPKARFADFAAPEAAPTTPPGGVPLPIYRLSSLKWVTRAQSVDNSRGLYPEVVGLGESLSRLIDLVARRSQ